VRRSLILLSLACAFRFCLATSPAAEPAAPRPNVIFILADDLGYAELGCYGQKKIKTPNIDRLAAEGMRFSQAYCGTSVCAPSRCSLMTGLHIGHAHIRANRELKPEGQEPLPPGTFTLGQLFQRAGYATACIGKWGLGGPGSTGEPNRQGFDHFFGYLCQAKAHEYYPPYLWRNTNRVELDGKTYSHDLIAAEALEYIKQNKEKAFFLYLPFTIPHAKLQVPSQAPYEAEPWPENEKNFAAMITRMDADVGRLLVLLKETRLEERTLVIFTSDNGAGHPPAFFNSCGALRGAKRDMYEGGIRTPMIVRWPGRIKAGTVSDQVWAFYDFLPTAAELTGSAIPAGVKTDGISVLPAFAGKPLSREYLYWELHEPYFRQALRSGDWKIVRYGLTRPAELYNLKEDPAEQHDRAKDEPERLAKLASLMSAAHVDSALWPASDRPEGKSTPKSPGKAKRAKTN
jgi:arylsulfatase A